MDDLAALDASAAEFGRRLAEVRDDQWAMPSRCGDWSVAELVNHVNVGNQMSVLLLNGADAQTSIGSDAQPPEGEDPKITFARTSAAQRTAFDAPQAMTLTVEHPAMPMPGELLLMFRTLDLAMHAWDLAASIGAAQDLDERMCTSIWIRLEPYAPVLSGSGMFGSPPRTLGPDAGAADVLLNATGR
jgi:uncharacterized protein (TIGR03086 family)